MLNIKNVNLDMIFLLVLAAFVGYYMCSKERFTENFAEQDDTLKAVRAAYNADVDAIKNLAHVSKQLQAGGLTIPGKIHIKSNDDNALHVTSRGNNPYITLGKTDTWANQALYMQNVNAHTNDPIFRIATHSGWHMSDMNKKDGARWHRKDDRWTNLDASDGKNYIRGDTIMDNNTTISGSLTVNGNCNIVPRGIIMMWNNAAPPPGWAICDGNNGTPNLINRFIVGAGSSEYPVGKTGGEKEVALNISQMPKHSHSGGHTAGCRNLRASGTSGCWMAGPPGPANTSEAGSSAPHENRPPYYALTYIMKL